MKCTQFYPVLMTGDVEGTARFYREHFRFTAAFESDWYVHLQSAEDESVNLAVLQGDHETIPEAGRGRAAGLLINFEVEDVDAEYARAEAAGLDPSRVSGHSPRAGLVTEAGRQGIPLQEVMQVSRHSDPRTALRYHRQGAARHNRAAGLAG